MDITSICLVGLMALAGWIILRSFFANPEQFLFALGVKLASFSVNVVKWVFHLVAGFLAAALGIIYLGFPLDFIPDVILGIGFIDDVLVIISTGLFVVNCFTSFPNPFKKA